MSLNSSFDWDMQLSRVTNESLTLHQVGMIFIISKFLFGWLKGLKNLLKYGSVFQWHLHGCNEINMNEIFDKEAL